LFELPLGPVEEVGRVAPLLACCWQDFADGASKRMVCDVAHQERVLIQRVCRAITKCLSFPFFSDSNDRRVRGSGIIATICINEECTDASRIYSAYT
jgi:hypothetical protein